MKVIYDESKRISEIQATPEESEIVKAFVENYFKAISDHEKEITARQISADKAAAEQIKMAYEMPFIFGSTGGIKNDL